MVDRKFLGRQRRRIERRLRYYDEVFKTRDAAYRHFKAGKVIPQLALALARIESGEYGKCISCGHPIPRKRLEAVPGANRCLKHQKEFECT